MTMDFAFVPGIGDPGLQRLADLFNRLPNTIVNLTPQPTALSDFFQAVDTVVGVTAADVPGNLLIGAHGDEEGNWYLSLDGKTAIPATYETIQNSTAIQIPADIRGPLTWVRLKSCLLGADSCHPLLVALSKAMGSPAALTAPRYLHAHLNGYLSGIWEFMMYQFVVVGLDSGKQPLADRNGAKTAFADPANNFQLVGSTAVPAQNWDTWIPPAASLNLNPARAAKAKKNISVTAPDFFSPGIPAFVPLETRWTSTQEFNPLTPLDSDFVPVGDDTIRQTLKDLLSPRGEYQGTHLYPVYVRYGFKNLDDFIQGWNWKVNDSSGTAKRYSLQYVGSRYRYRLEVPITKPGTNDLIYNFYPDSGAPIVNFSETNDPFKLFGLV
jgi:hypothetical protein